MKLKISLVLNAVLLATTLVLTVQNFRLRIDEAVAEHYFPLRDQQFEGLKRHLTVGFSDDNLPALTFDNRLPPLGDLRLLPQPKNA